jgi:restriction system protein
MGECSRFTSRARLSGRDDWKSRQGPNHNTNTFTTDAQSEAVRDGASPIELVDGQALVNLLEKLELGLIPRTTYEVDTKFFEEFDH